MIDTPWLDFCTNTMNAARRRGVEGLGHGYDETVPMNEFLSGPEQVSSE